MSGYRVEWSCCGDETYTQAWEPEECPFCEVSSLQSEVERLRGRCGELENCLSVAVQILEDQGAAGSIMGRFRKALSYNSNAWLLIKQAEAIEPAIRTALRNLGNADLSEEDIARFAEDYAQRLRQQAAESEK